MNDYLLYNSRDTQINPIAAYCLASLTRIKRKAIPIRAIAIPIPRSCRGRAILRPMQPTRPAIASPRGYNRWFGRSLNADRFVAE